MLHRPIRPGHRQQDSKTRRPRSSGTRHSYIYFVAFDVTQGWTPGKKLLGLSVHGTSGGKPTLKEAAIREAFNVLNIIPFFIGFILQVIAEIVIAVTINSSPTKQGKHDEFAGGTQVLKG